MDISREERWQVMGWNEPWECFMKYLERHFPFDEKVLRDMPLICRNAVIAHLYDTEVIGDGHSTFLELYGDIITAHMLTEALGQMNAPAAVTDIAREFGKISPDDEEALEELDRNFYSLPPYAITETIAEYVKNHIKHFKS